MVVRIKTMVLILLFFHCACSAAADRIAVIPVGDGDPTSIAPLLASALQKQGLENIEPVLLEQVLKDQQLDQTLGSDATGARANLGRSLKAAFLIFISSPTQPKPHLKVTLCETTEGVRLSTPSFDPAPADQEVVAIDAAVTLALSKAHQPNLRFVAVGRFDSDDSSTKFDYRRAAFAQLLRQTLERRDDLLLVDYAEAQSIVKEQATDGQADPDQERPLILKGRMKDATMDPGAPVTLTLSLTDGSATRGTWSSGSVAVEEATAKLPGAALNLVNKALGENTPAPPKVEAAELAAQGRELMRSGSFADAYDMLEAAICLNPTDASVHGDAFRALGSQIDAEIKQLTSTTTDDDQRDALLKKYADANQDRLLSGLSDMEYYFTNAHVSLNQASWDLVAAKWFISLAPKQDLHDANFRILQYKHDHRIKDDWIWMCCQLAQNEDANRSLDQTTDYVARMADVWFSGNLRWSCDAFYNAATLYLHPSANAPEIQRMLAHMDASANPEAPIGAAEIRKLLAVQANPASAHPTSATQSAIQQRKRSQPPPQPNGPVGAVYERFPIPTDDHLEEPGWAPAGPHADVYFGRLTRSDGLPVSRSWTGSYIRSDGFHKKLPNFTGRYGPVFDGRFVWFVGSESSATAIYAYDTQADRLSFAGAAQGVPAGEVDIAALAAIKQGTVCIAASTGQPPAQSWVALATTDGSAAPTCKVLLESNDRQLPPVQDGPLSMAFAPTFMFVLPGPPGARDKATPQVYLGRGLKQMLLVDPQTGTCTLTRAKKFDPRVRYFQRDEQPIVWQDKLYDRLRIWDPVTDSIKVLPKPPNLQKFGRTGCAMFDGQYFLFDGGSLFAGPVGEPLHQVRVQFATQFNPFQSTQSDLVATANLGLISNGGGQLRLTREVDPARDPATLDYFAWLQRRIAFAPDAAGYDALAQYYAARHQDELSLEAEEKYFDLADPDLYLAEDEVQVADSLMNKGDYARASKIADDAARTGAEWALIRPAFAAEGLGDWSRAEQIFKDAEHAYGRKLAWYFWCVRTGHGDLAAAKVEAAQVIAEADANPQPDQLEDAAFYYLVSGDNAKALPLLKRVCSENHDVWAGLNVSLLAAESGDAATRDAALAAVVSDKDLDSGSLAEVAARIQLAFKTNGTLPDDRFKAIADDWENRRPTGARGSMYYAAGRFLLLKGEKDRAIKYLNCAAGWNSGGVSRTLATQLLRSLGVQPPKPGQGQ